MRRTSESGYIALLSILIIGAISLSIGLALLSLGSDSQRRALVDQKSKQAHGLAVACAEEALQVIHDNNAYTGTGSLTLGQGTCSYTVAAGPAITASGTVGGVVKKLQIYATIGATSISVSSWQEVQ